MHAVGLTGDHDSLFYIERANRWLDVAASEKEFYPLLYACIDGRFGIEQRLFEFLIICQGGRLSEEEYRECITHRSRLQKLIDKNVPYHRKLQQFTMIVVSLLPPPRPPVIYWDLKELLRSWGTLSHYLHWSGARTLTTEEPKWLQESIDEVSRLLRNLRIKFKSGGIGALDLSTSKPAVVEIWEAFRDNRIDQTETCDRLRSLT